MYLGSDFVCFLFITGSTLSPAATSGFGVGEANSSSTNGQSSAGASGAPGSVNDAAAAADPLAGVDEETRGILRKAGLTKMPVTSADWVKFERVQKGTGRVYVFVAIRFLGEASLSSMRSACATLLRLPESNGGKPAVFLFCGSG